MTYTHRKTLARNPSKDVLEDVYRQYQSLVRARISRWVSNDVVDDAVQEVFIIFMKHVRNHDVVNVVGLLCQIAMQEGRRRAMRKERERVTLDGDDKLSNVVDTRLGAEERLVFHKMLGRVRKDLALMALYYHVEGLTQSEVAKRLGVSQHHVSEELQNLSRRANRESNRGAG